MASIVIALGPGFSAPDDAHAVIETMRGHNLGRVIFSGAALPDTGTPGDIGGQSARRVVRTPRAGKVRLLGRIGQVVEEGEPLFIVDGVAAEAPFAGLVRGLIRDGFNAPAGLKAADVDPRIDSDWQGISDKARCIGGSALEAYLYLRRGFC